MTGRPLFTRGAGSANALCAAGAVDSIAYERVELPAGYLAVPNTLTANGQFSATSGAFTAVDTTRSVAFAGGQMAAGQAIGETDLTSSNQTRTSRALMTITGGGTTVTATREVNTGIGKWTSYVIQLQP